MHSSAGLSALPLAAHQIDRRDADRRREDWLQQVWAVPDTRVLLLKDRTTPVHTDDAGAGTIRFVSPESIAAQPPEGTVYLSEVPALQSSRPFSDNLYSDGTPRRSL